MRVRGRQQGVGRCGNVHEVQKGAGVCRRVHEGAGRCKRVREDTGGYRSVHNSAGGYRKVQERAGGCRSLQQSAGGCRGVREGAEGDRRVREGTVASNATAKYQTPARWMQDQTSVGVRHPCVRGKRFLAREVFIGLELNHGRRVAYRQSRAKVMCLPREKYVKVRTYFEAALAAVEVWAIKDE